MNRLKFSLLGTVIVLLSATFAAQAQVPYTPFPKDSLSWHLWGGSYNCMEHSFNVSISGFDTTINNKIYTQVWQLGIGIREENKRVYAYIPEYGEHLLYDFNLEIGDTIFYNIGMFICWGMSSVGGYQSAKHYAVVMEKGTTTLNNGSIRNTVTLQTYDNWMFNSIRWIEGLGATNMIGLLDPLVYTQALDGTAIQLICICESYNSSGCLLYSYCGNHVGILNIGCPCKPTDNKIIENKENKITISPNPVSTQLIIECRDGARPVPTGEYTIYNVVGQVVLYGETANNTPLAPLKGGIDGVEENSPFKGGRGMSEITIDVSHLAKGMYFLRIDNKVVKFVKE